MQHTVSWSRKPLPAGGCTGTSEKTSPHLWCFCSTSNHLLWSTVRNGMLGQTGWYRWSYCPGLRLFWATGHSAIRKWALCIRAEFSKETAALNRALSWTEVSVIIKLNTEVKSCFFKSLEIIVTSFNQQRIDSLDACFPCQVLFSFWECRTNIRNQ